MKSNERVFNIGMSFHTSGRAPHGSNRTREFSYDQDLTIVLFSSNFLNFQRLATNRTSSISKSKWNAMMRNPTAHSRKRNKWYALMISSLGPTKQNTLPFKVETNELNLCFRKFGIFGQKHLKHCVFWLFYLLQLSNSSISKIQPKIHFLSGP